MKLIKRLAMIALVVTMGVQLVACTNTETEQKDNEVSKVSNAGIEDDKISMAEYNLAYEILSSQYKQQYGEEWLNDENNKAVIEDNALSQLLIEKTAKVDVKDIEITDEEFNSQLTGLKEVLGGEDNLKKILSNNNITDNLYKAIVKDRMMVSKFISQKAEAILGEMPSDDELKTMYDASPEAYNQIQASHILVATEEEAKNIKKQLDEGMDFATLAKEKSTCPSASQGGDLGFFNSGSMVKEFSDVAFKLKINEISEPVKTQFGYHIIKVTGEKNSFDTIDKSNLSNQIVYAKFEKYLDDILNKASIGVPEELKVILERVKSAQNVRTEK